MSVRAFAPATVANVACGFDVLGLALERPGDAVTAESVPTPGVRLESVEGDDGRLPTDPARNTAGVAARDLLVRKGVDDRGVRLRLSKGLPLASGMGSSAASAVAAVVAVDHALELQATPEELLASALAGESVAAGASHPDNAAACLLGGFLLVRSAEPLDIVRLPVPEGLSVALVRPHVEISTRDSRGLLGDTVPLADAVAQWANLGALVAGLFRNDLELVSRALVDRVAEPARAPHVPGFDAAKRAALDGGALGCSLSGSGPSIFALCRSLEDAGRVTESMARAVEESAGVEASRHASPVAESGARVEAEPCAS